MTEPDPIQLPRQPEDVPWPDGDWPSGPLPPPGARPVRALLDAAFAEPQPDTTLQTNDLLVVHR